MKGTDDTIRTWGDGEVVKSPGDEVSSGFFKVCSLWILLSLAQLLRVYLVCVLLFYKDCSQVAGEIRQNLGEVLPFLNPQVFPSPGKTLKCWA